MKEQQRLSLEGCGALARQRQKVVRTCGTPNKTHFINHQNLPVIIHVLTLF